MFFEGGGVTLTGGEVGLQLDRVKQLLIQLKKEQINTCIETNGTSPRLPELFPFLDYLIMYLDCHGAGEGLPLYGSGNGLRKNPQLCQLVEERFGRKLQLSSLPEEAACGAAVWAARQ